MSPPRLRLRWIPSTQTWGQARSRGRLRRSPTEADALSLRSETAAAEAPEPQGISEASSILRVGTPARHISITASSTLVSRRR